MVLLLMALLALRLGRLCSHDRLSVVNIEPQEVINLMQQRFPQEFEIVVLTIQNQKLAAEAANAGADNEED